jgi:hypothetical protein
MSGERSRGFAGQHQRQEGLCRGRPLRLPLQSANRWAIAAGKAGQPRGLAPTRNSQKGGIGLRNTYMWQIAGGISTG